MYFSNSCTTILPRFKLGIECLCKPFLSHMMKKQNLPSLGGRNAIFRAIIGRLRVGVQHVSTWSRAQGIEIRTVVQITFLRYTN